jgi:hypothetical protein
MATNIQLSQGFSMPSWTYRDQEPMNVLGAIDAGLNLSNKVMDQPNIKRGRKVQAMQQEKVLSGEMPITVAQAGPDGMVTGRFQDGLTYELERALDQAKNEEAAASADYRRAQAAAVGPQSQSVIDLNNARAQATLGGVGGVPVDIPGVGQGMRFGNIILGPDGKQVAGPGVASGTSGIRVPSGYRMLPDLEDPQGYKLEPIPGGPADGGGSTGGLTPGQRSLDQAVGKEYAEYVASGGSATAMKNIEQVRTGIETLRGTDTASGWFVGNLPDGLRRSFTPEGMSAQDYIQGAIMQSLRQILGAQFTQKEGERLMAQTYDKRAPEAENIRRAERLLRQLEGAAVAKEEAMRYFETNRTMVGFQGKFPNISDFDVTSGGSSVGGTEVDPTRRVAAPTPQAPASIPTVSTREEVNALPSGTQFIGPDGVVRVKR